MPKPAIQSLPTGSPRSPKALGPRSATREAAQWDSQAPQLESGYRILQLGKAHTQQRRHSTDQNKKQQNKIPLSAKEIGAVKVKVFPQKLL